MAESPPLPGAAVAAEYLDVLLSMRYKQRWQREVQNQPHSDRVRVSAVARLIDRHLAGRGESPTEGYPQIRDRVGRALLGQELTTATLDQLIAALEIGAADADQLWTLARQDSATKLVTGTALPPLGLYQAIGPRRHRTVMLHEAHQVGPDRLPASHRVIQTIEATVDGLDYYPVVFDTNAATVTVRRGGLPGPIYRVDDSFCALNIQLAEPLQVGQTVLMEYVIGFNYTEAPPPELRRAVFHRIEKLMVEVRFDPAAAPARVYWAEWDRFASDAIKRREALELDSTRTVHSYHEDINDSIVGFYWEW